MEKVNELCDGSSRIKLDVVVFFFSSRRRHTRCSRDWSSDVCFFRSLHVVGEILILHASDADRADARDTDHAVPIDHGAVVEIDLSPGPYLELVSRTDDIARGQIGRASCRERVERAVGGGVSAKMRSQ